MSRKPVNCRYFYGDYHRGNNVEECRLVHGNPSNERPWQRKLCDSCAIPELLLTSNCRNLLLEGTVKRRLLRSRVEVDFAVCADHLIELDDPLYCPECAKEEKRRTAGAQ